MAGVDSFEDLECYKTARGFRCEVSRLSKQFPGDEKFRLTDQIIRSSRSVTANTAEGFGRQHPQENLQFCRQARGSLVETLEHLNTALDENYISTDTYQTLRQQWNTTKALLSGYVRYLESITRKDRRFIEGK